MSPGHGGRDLVSGGQPRLYVVPLSPGYEGVRGRGVGGEEDPEQQPDKTGPALDIEDTLPAPAVSLTVRDIMLQTADSLKAVL